VNISLFAIKYVWNQ